MSSEPQSVNALLVYFAPPKDGSKPYTMAYNDPTSAIPRMNWTPETHTMQIENLRGKEDSVTLATAGFQYGRSPSAHKAFTSEEAIKVEYYPETIELVKKLTGASRIVPFDHTIRRRRRPGEADSSPDARQPVPQVHVDQTTASAIARVHRHLPAEDAPALLARRFQIINLWRPIARPAHDWPLALCDFRSVDPRTDLVPTDLVYEDHKGETNSVRFNPGHQWKYLPGMTPDEFVLIKCYDSKSDDQTAILTPHTAFQDPSTPADAPLRESIEVRLLVFYD